MVPMASSEAIQSIVRGHVLLAACAALYLTWWIVFFRPNVEVTGLLYGFGGACLLLAAVAGFMGAGMVGVALPGFAGGAHAPLPAFVACAVIAYAVLAAVTRAAFDRPVTTELALIVAWCSLELACATALAAGGILSIGTASCLCVLIVLLTTGSLVAYVLYYNLGPLASFIDGAVPLAAVGIEAVIVVLLLR